jgi:hypothetical protein
LELLLGFQGAGGRVCHLKNHFCRFIICGVVSHSLLHTVDYLLHQVGVVALEIGLFKGVVCRLAKFLVSSTKVVFEIDPCFFNVWSAIPVSDVSLEASGFVKRMT